MFTATTDQGFVTWDNGTLTGDEDHVRVVHAAIEIDNPSAMFNYWGERDAALTPEFTAYITIGYALQSEYGEVEFDNIPDNPDGYEPEGPDEEPDEIVASVVTADFYNHNHDSRSGRFTAAGSGGFRVITKAQARGDSRPVSHDEFQRLAQIGQKKLDAFSAHSAPHIGLDQNWDKIKMESYAEVRKSWGGATIGAHTGEALPQGANAFAITVKGKGVKPVSVHEHATEAEFSAAMDRAKQEFSSILQRKSHYLGVFHDDENHRIDIDPVLVVTKRSDVDTIGAASHSIGGAYNFSDGNGYWPPHVAEEG